MTISPPFRRILLLLTIGGVLGVLISPLNPVASRFLRLAFLGCLGGAWLGMLAVLWSRKRVRLALLLAPLLAIAPFLLPAREIDPAELRADYLARMQALEGTRYYWGGENAIGIDCSGLPRRALRDALLSQGFRRADGGAFRNFAEQWWFDASARALRDGHRGYTIPLEPIGTIKAMDYTGLQPGDLAVTKGGAHILAYLGENLWIQSDPGLGEVAILDGRKDENSWFGLPVTTHRWAVLAER